MSTRLYKVWLNSLINTTQGQNVIRGKTEKELKELFTRVTGRIIK